MSDHSSQTQPNTIEVFFSYSHRDEDLMKELIKHLSILKRQGVIQAWHDRQITAGTEWEGQIDQHLNSAQIILLLISPDFMASDYCYDIELTRAMERHQSKTACVIPVILRPVDWKGASFGKLQSLPKDAKPITSWTNQDEAFLNVAQGIRQAIEQMSQFNQAQASSQTSTNLQAAIERVLSGNQNQDDLQAIASAIKTGQITLATGSRSVPIGGNAANAVVITGDRNVIVQGEVARSLQNLLDTLNPGEASSQALSNASGADRSPSQQRRIQQEIDSLQQMYDLLSEKLQRLRRDWAIQAGSAIAFQLEKEIEQAEAERTKIEKRLKELEK